MNGYNRTYWQDHVSERLNTYRETKNDDGTITHTPIEGEIIQQGTPQNQRNFNNMEEGIFAANELGAELARIARLNNCDIKAIKGVGGTVNLDNSLEYPFNNSVQTVNLPYPLATTEYDVMTEILSDRLNVGDVVIYDKQRNGFKIAYTGSAKIAKIRYTTKGGFIDGERNN